MAIVESLQKLSLSEIGSKDLEEGASSVGDERGREGEARVELALKRISYGGETFAFSRDARGHPIFLFFHRGSERVFDACVISPR
jgi:hypothetical protein